MNQQQKLRTAKENALKRFGAVFEDMVQIDDYKFASLEEVEGEEIWVVCALTAKKNFNIDDAVDDWEFKQDSREKKKLAKSPTP